MAVCCFLGTLYVVLEEDIDQLILLWDAGEDA
jgi:hypothetical protein